MRRKYLTWWKSRPFTQAQIDAKTYEVWEKRGRRGTSEENRQAAIVALERERSFLWRLRRIILLPFRFLARLLQLFWRLFGDSYRFAALALRAETPTAALEIIKVVISAFGVLATVFAGVGLYLTYQNSQAERELSIERLQTERFSKAVEQLGSQDINVRIGGIYSLEQIAKESPDQYHWTVMEVLTAYIRQHSPLPENWLKTAPEKREILKNVTTDVQSALTVIGRRKAEKDPPDKRLDLSKTNLAGALFFIGQIDDVYNGGDASAPGISLPEGANFERANFAEASLRGAAFLDTKLRGANFYSADLSGLDLSDVDLRGAILHGADLIDTTLIGAYLTGADFADANLHNASLGSAHLTNADFTDANLSSANFHLAELLKANLAGTNLSGANLKDSDLKGASFDSSSPHNFNDVEEEDAVDRTRATILNQVEPVQSKKTFNRHTEGITVNQVKQAKNWQQAEYDPDFRQKLGIR